MTQIRFKFDPEKLVQALAFLRRMASAETSPTY
jgi:hypothetical protein